MAVRVLCQCGTSYELKDEFAGRLVQCPQCGRENRAPALSVSPAPMTTAGDPVFDRDVFLLRQQFLKISEKYDVCDEQGNKIVFVERPAHLLQNVGALLAGLVAGGLVVAGCLALTELTRGTALEVVFGVLAVVGAIVAFAVVGVGLSAKRHVTFYRDQTKRERLLEIRQDRKWQPITATYTVRDPSARPIARLSKNYLHSILRKRWVVIGGQGRGLALAKEDSVILALLRRVIGPLFGLLRTNFIIVRPESDEVIGEFNRKFTILDRYALDLKADPQRTFDRRVALALGVMLDTGERR